MNLFQDIAGSELGSIIFTGIVAMLPVVELRGAIPIGVGLGLDIWRAFVVSVIGNMIPVPFIMLFIRRIFTFLKRWDNVLSRFVKRLEKKVDMRSEAIYRSELIGLFIFVAIPLPGTGAWTGALIAALLNLRFKTAIPAIMAGVIVAGILVTALTYGVSAFVA